jgi:hypothetical protein
MWWEFYHWVWPLFTVCHPGYGLDLTLTPADGILYQVGNLPIPLCPTLAMQLLLSWALFGVLSFSWFSGLLVVRLFLGLTSKRRSVCLGPNAFLDEMDTEIDGDPQLESVLADLNRKAKAQLRRSR